MGDVELGNENFWTQSFKKAMDDAEKERHKKMNQRKWERLLLRVAQTLLITFMVVPFLLGLAIAIVFLFNVLMDVAH